MSSITKILNSLNPSSGILEDAKKKNQQFFREFIYKYRRLPQLWDHNHEYYKNKYKRNAAYDLLLGIMKKYDPNSNRYHVRQKVNSLRSNYRKDLRRLLDSKTILPNGDEVYHYKPVSWKFYALRFLDSIESDCDETVEPETQEVLIEDSNFEETSFDYNSFQEGEQNTESHCVFETEKFTDDVNSYRINYIPSKKRKIKIENNPDTLEVLNDLQVIYKEYEVIGANVALKLRRMTEQQRIHAELLINKVLINGLKNNLTDDTDLTDLQVLDTKTFLEDYE